MRRRGRIDPAAHQPVYHQLADILRDAIMAGEYPPGSLLPNQVRLAQEHELGVDTVRDALAVLRREGLIITVRGQGSRVRPLVVSAVTGAVGTALSAIAAFGLELSAQQIGAVVTALSIVLALLLRPAVSPSPALVAKR